MIEQNKHEENTTLLIHENMTNRLVVMGFMDTTRKRPGHPLVTACTSPTNSKWPPDKAMQHIKMYS